MTAFLVTTVIVIIAVVLIYAAVKRWFREDYDETVSGKPTALYDEEIPPEEFPDDNP
ncbi:MAG: hypothetical protein QNJ71_02130 [Acidimicrobiia bacterium]|nr:hypothetical protein [Acidimicrobiia bacterium]